MAIFGVQLCITLIAASFLQKLSPIYSLGRWLVSGGQLVRFILPSDSELRKLLGKSGNGKSKNKKNGLISEETFKLQKKLQIPLDTVAIRSFDVAVLRSYVDYEWMVDYLLHSLLVYTATEVYYYFWQPVSDFNLSLIWLALSALFAIRGLLAVLWLYAKSKAGGELSLSIAFAMVSFILSLTVLMIKGDSLDFKINSQNHSEISENVLNLPRLQLFLAGVSSFLGLLFIFPAIRMAQMYVDAVKFSAGNLPLQVGLHANFFAPAVLSFMWIQPLLNAVTIDPRTGVRLVTSYQVEIGRVVLLMLICLLRVSMMRLHLQAYLNLAYERVIKLRKESGTILNTELQRLVAQVFYYFGVVLVQYMSPIVLLLCSTLCLKTLAGYSWFGFEQIPVEVATNAHQYFGDSLVKEMIGGLEEKFPPIFDSTIMCSVMAYVVWWCNTSWFAASCVGLFYHHYLTE